MYLDQVNIQKMACFGNRFCLRNVFFDHFALQWALFVAFDSHHCCWTCLAHFESWKYFVSRLRFEIHQGTIYFGIHVLFGNILVREHLVARKSYLVVRFSDRVLSVFLLDEFQHQKECIKLKCITGYIWFKKYWNFSFMTNFVEIWTIEWVPRSGLTTLIFGSFFDQYPVGLKF